MMMKNNMEKINAKGKLTFGILADVDKGKTTLSNKIIEYIRGKGFELNLPEKQKNNILSKKSSKASEDFFDSRAIESKRNITFFSKYLSFSYRENLFFLVDTPGHFDLASERERIFPILDFAIVVIDTKFRDLGKTIKLIEELRIRNIKFLLFINKMDLADETFSKKELLDSYKNELNIPVIEYSRDFDFSKDVMEEISLVKDEYILEFIENDYLSKKSIENIYSSNGFVPAIFGSALKTNAAIDVLDFLSFIISKNLLPNQYDATSKEKSLYVFKIDHSKGKRETLGKVLKGTYKKGDYLNDEEIKSGVFEAGEIVSILDLEKTYEKELFVSDKSIDNTEFLLPLSIRYKIYTLEEKGKAFFDALDIISEEFPELEIKKLVEKNYGMINLSGDMKKEQIENIFEERFDIKVQFEKVIFKKYETILGEEEEQVYLGLPEMTPYLKLNVNSTFDYDNKDFLITPNRVHINVRKDQIDNDFLLDIVSDFEYRLNSNYFARKEDSSILTNLDVIINSGAGNLSHLSKEIILDELEKTFYRILLKSKTILIEKQAEILITSKNQNLGELSFIIDNRKGRIIEESLEEANIFNKNPKIKIFASIPYEELENFILDLKKSSLFYLLDIKSIEYKAREMSKVADRKYLNFLKENDETITKLLNQNIKKEKKVTKKDEGIILDCFDILNRISRKGNKKNNYKKDKQEYKREIREYSIGKVEKDHRKKLLIIDGYNIIFQWKDLKELSRINLGSSRDELIEIMSKVKSFLNTDMMIVFDAYKTKENLKNEVVSGIKIVYTKENETADKFIEKYVFDNSKLENITVATSDRLEQMNVFTKGAKRLSARDLKVIVDKIKEEISSYLS